MSEPPSTESDQLRALQDFEGDPDLEALEMLLGRFNIFEALGVARAERNHSKFLGFLLNPRERHRLGERFLKRFLHMVLENPPKAAPMKQREIDTINLSRAKIFIEYWDQADDARTDILIRDDLNNMSVIVENKIDAMLGPDQLEKYYQRELTRFPLERCSERRILGVYLTKNAVESGNDHYAAFCHKQIQALIMELFEDPDLHLAPEVQFGLRQYADAIRRNLMIDEGIKKRCEGIYKQHKQAIDLIFKYKTNSQALAYGKLKELVEADSELILDDCEERKTARFVRFIPRALDMSYFRFGSQRASNRLILFEFKIEKSVWLFLEMGPGDPDRRKRIHDFALAGLVFPVAKGLDNWQCLFKKQIVERLDDYLDADELLQMIESKWQAFLEDDLPRIEQAFKAHPWPVA